MLEFIVYVVIIVALIAASVNDIKTREVPDWLSYSLIAIGFAVRLIFSLIYSEPVYILEGLFGFGVFLGLSLLLFYAGMWGGGDSKLLMGLGAMLGLSYTNVLESFIVIFFIMMMFAGSIYGLIWSMMLALSHKKKFVRMFKAIFHHEKIHVFRRVLAVFLVAALILYLLTFQSYNPYLNMAYVLLLFLVLLIFYLWIFSKAVEMACMYKWVKPAQLTEGDWIVNDVVVRGKRITGPKDLGIEKEQIAKLMKLKVKNVLIKEGIPFVPTFLIAFVLTLFLKDFVVGLIYGLL